MLSQNNRVPLFVELCAGTAALSLRLHRYNGKPPFSRMGAKTGYVDAILQILGLRPGQGADMYLWCEPDSGVRLLLNAYRNPKLAHEAATILRSWVSEEPRQLWDRLYAEDPSQSPSEAFSFARWALLGQWSYRRGIPHSGFAQSRACVTDNRGMTVDRLVGLVHNISAKLTLSAMIANDAREILRPNAPPGTVVFIDPPYQNTTGYDHDLPRAEVVTLAHRWATAGAVVAISEAEPIPELVREGWFAVRFDGERRNQKRMFSTQQTEWLTLNRPPAWTPPIQTSLFTVRPSC